MAKKYKILLITLLLSYPLYKGIREFFWVRHSAYIFDTAIEIKVRHDQELFSFQDTRHEKTISLTNKITHSNLNISYTSLEPNLYFYIDSIDSKNTLVIIDEFAGENKYDYSTLKLLTKKDCFKEFGGCGGVNDSFISKLKPPFLIYDITGFHP